MNKSVLAAIGGMALIFSAPVFAQDYPLDPGSYWDVTEVTIDDGHFGDYADFLAGQWKATQDFAKSKGWIKDYHIVSNIYKRANEPDLYLVTIYDRVPTAAEQLAREKEFDAFMKNSGRQREAGSAERAKYRHVGGSSMLQELVFKK